MIEGYVGQWQGKGIQKPSDFQRNRVIGELKIKLPECPKQEDIAYFDLPKKDQYFRPTPVPRNFEDLEREERVAFMSQEFNRRSKGFWFYNNGTIEYITGIHYFYINYWKIDIGLPEFRDSDRDLYYAWDYCVEDDQSFGLEYFTNRRSGKTVVGTNIIYEYASRNEDSECGIQSKTKPDGKKVFTKLVGSWKKLNAIWKPTDSGETNPREELRFEEPSKRSTKGAKKTYDKVLNSIISFKASVEEAYDGYKLKRYYCDEFGKFVEGNAYERWEIVKPCLVVGTKIVGKAYFTTTVEELDRKGGQAALDMYNDSNPNERKADGRTITGMYRLFKPAYYGLEGFVNKYGYSDIEGAKSALLKQRDGLTGAKLAGEVRKFPFTAKEAFYNATGDPTFPAHKIYEQKEYNESLPESIVRRGDFVWDDMSQHQVSFHDNPDGMFEVAWMPEEGSRCKFEMDNRGFPQPMFSNTGVIGVDPFDHKDTVDSRRSNASADYFKKFDTANPSLSNCWVMHYCGRRDDPSHFYEDMIKAAVFYGVKILCENQKPGLLNYMNNRGYKRYIHMTKQSDYTKSNSRNDVEGISMAGKLVRDEAINTLIGYIHRFIGKISIETQKKEYGWTGDSLKDDLYGFCPFPSVLDDWLKFDPNNWTVSDETVSTMISLLGVTPVRGKKGRKEEVKTKLSLESFFNTYNLR